MPKKTRHLQAALFTFLLLLLTSCTTSKFAQQYNEPKLDIVQNNLPQPYIAQPENTSEAKQNTTEASTQTVTAPAEDIKIIKTPIKHTRNLKTTAQQSVQKLRKLAPDTRIIVQTASKEWNPRKQNWSLNWKDVVFIIVLLALLALMVGILHNLLGLAITIALLIALGVAFLVICIYIWYLNND
jgi:hypothetical protein